MPLLIAAASRRVQLAMARGEVPFREGLSVYLNRIEGQVRLRTADGTLTNAGRQYIESGGDERLTHIIAPHAQTFRRGHQVLAYGIHDKYGAGRTFRVHTENLQDQHTLTHAGRLFQGHEQMDFEVHVPVSVRYKRSDGWSVAYSTNFQGSPITQIVSPDAELIGDLASLNSGYAADGQETIEREVKRATMEWFRREVEVRRANALQADVPTLEKMFPQQTKDGWFNHIRGDLQPEQLQLLREKLIDEVGLEVPVYIESDAYYFVKSNEDITEKPGWSFDMKTTFRDHGQPKTHVLLGLPRRGIVDMPDEMWGKMKLFPEAIKDYQREGKNCVVQQLALALRVDYRPRDGDKQKKEIVEQFTVEEVEWNLDLIFEELYPGYYLKAGNKTIPEKVRDFRAVLATKKRSWGQAFSDAQSEAQGLEAFAELWKHYWSGCRRLKRFKLEELYEVVRKGNAQRFGIGAKAFHDTLKSFFGGRDLLAMYRQFFAGYPNLYAVAGGFVAAVFDHYEGEEECHDEPKAWPYKEAGWRELGPDSRMIIELCRRLGRRCRVIHNDVCIYEFIPENPSKDSMIVWAIWGDHVFFYKDVAGAQFLKVMQPMDATAPVLQTRNDLDGETGYRRIEYKDMQAWCPDRFKELYHKKESATFRTSDIDEVADCLRSAKVDFNPSWRDPNFMKHLTIKFKHERTTIRIMGVPQHAYLLETICDEAGIPYYGENWGGIAVRVAEELCTNKRPANVQREPGLCWHCGCDALDYEMHHPVQPMRGGDPHAVEAVCIDCHAWLTDLQRMGLNSAGKLSFYSELSPEETVLWEETAKPRQICWGDGKVSDSLRCVDVKNCRPDMLFTAARLPIFGPMDAPTAFVPDLFHGYDYFFVEKYPLRKYGDDEEMIDVAPYHGPGRYHLDAVKYMLDKKVITFADIKYALAASRYLPPEKLKDTFGKMKDFVEAAWDKHMNDERVDDRHDALRGLQKTFVLALIGTMNRPPATEWTVRSSACAYDVPGATIVTLDLDKKKLPKYKAQRRVYDNRTALPIGLIALQKEACAVDWAARCARELGLTIHGGVVDCVIYSVRQEERKAKERELKELLNKYDFQYDFKKKFTLPNCEQGKAKPAPQRPLPKCLTDSWIRVDERDGPRVEKLRRAANSYNLGIEKKIETTLPQTVMDNIGEFLGNGRVVGSQDDIMRKLAVLVVTNRGAAIIGKPGTGKTKLLAELIPTWKSFEDVNFACGAYTIAASRLMPRGKSLEHWRRTYARRVPKNLVMAIDEINMVGISFLAVLGRFQRLGASFVLMGDFEGQQLPIFDGWDCPRIGDTDLIRQLARGFEITLSRNRRYNDDQLWNRICRLYDHIDNPKCVKSLQRLYPWQGATPDLCLVKSHKKRRLVNAFLNQRDRDGVFIASPGKIKGSATQPQDMWVKPGTILLGCASHNKKIVSGLEYQVQSVDDATVAVSMRAPWRTSDANRATLDAKSLQATQLLEDNVECTHEEAARWLRLAYAITYTSVEGRTIPERTIMLLDTANPYYTNRDLIVGISRAKGGVQVKIPTPDEERHWIAAMPEVPDEVDKDAPEEVFEPLVVDEFEG